MARTAPRLADGGCAMVGFGNVFCKRRSRWDEFARMCSIIPSSARLADWDEEDYGPWADCFTCENRRATSSQRNESGVKQIASTLLLIVRIEPLVHVDDQPGSPSVSRTGNDLDERMVVTLRFASRVHHRKPHNNVI